MKGECIHYNYFEVYRSLLKLLSLISIRTAFFCCYSDQDKYLDKIFYDVLKVMKWDMLLVVAYRVGLDEFVEDFQNEILKNNHHQGGRDYWNMRDKKVYSS